MKRFLVLLKVLPLFIGISAYAQTQSGYFSIRTGLSFPFADYSSYKLDGGGFTSSGFNVGADASWFFYKGIGLEVSGSMNFHPVEVGVLGYEIVMNDPFMTDTYIRSEAYNIKTLMIGPVYKYMLNDRFHIITKLQAGFAEAKTPHQIHKPVYQAPGPPMYEITSSINRQFAMIAGLGVRYDFTPCYGLIFNAEFFSKEFGFGFNTANGLRTDYKTISFVNLNVGVQFNLWSAKL